MRRRSAVRILVALTAALWMAAGTLAPAWPQEAPTTEAMVSALSGLEAPSDLDVPALRQQAAERIKTRADAIALKRPPLSRELNKLPHINLDIQFNPDTPVIRPESYRTIARIADALTDPALMSVAFLIVGHMDATGRRDNNLALSQRRAEAVRDALVTTFRISSKRVFAVGLGEEQLLDANNPKAAVNQQCQVVALREIAPGAGGGSVKPPEAGRAAKSRKAGR
jgi:OmpA-OmpF porin, OOP family